MRQRGVWPAWAPVLFVTLALSGPLAAPARAAADAPAPQRAVIVSLRGEEATLNAGANKGLSVGMELPVMQGDRVVGHIVISQVSADAATGRLAANPGATIRALDSVALSAAPPTTPALPPSPAPRVPAPTVAAPPAPRTDARAERLPSYNEHAADTIPWERWEYMALSSLAASGLLPGYASREFQGERTFTRGELANLTATALVNFEAGAGTERDRVFLDRLAREFRYQPAVRRTVNATREMDLGPPANRPAGPGALPALAPTLEKVPGLSLYAGPRFVDFRGKSELSLTGRAGGIYDVGKDAFVALSVNNLHDRFSALPDAFDPIDVLTLNLRAWDVDWEIGKSYWSSGPLHSGDGLLSDNAPGLYMLKGRKTFSWGKFPGKFIITQLHAGFPDNGSTKYYGLRRVEKRLNKNAELGLAEAYVATKQPNPLILIFPFYAYQHVEILGGKGSNRDNDTFNYMAQIDLSLKMRSSFTLYGEIFIDDMAAPSGLGAGFNAPRKIGMVLGGHFPKLFGWRGDGRFEIYHADREAYLGIAPQVGWNRDNLLLGNPFGPNSQAFSGRVDYRFTEKLKGAMILRDAVQYKNGVPDMGDRLEWDTRVAYDFTPSHSASLRYVHHRYRGQAYTKRENAVEVFGSYAY